MNPKIPVLRPPGGSCIRAGCAQLPLRLACDQEF